MRYLPINLDIRGKKVVIVGGGAVAERKCLTVLSAGGRVTVVSPTLTDTLRGLSEQGGIEHLPMEYSCGDLEDAFLVFAATSDSGVNAKVAEEARIRGIMADITGAPDLGRFTSPALVNRGELLITVSTGGESPALAAKIREELDEQYGPEYSGFVRILGRVREKLLTEKINIQYNKQILRGLVNREIPALLKKGAYGEVDRILFELCGQGFSLAELETLKRMDK
jgi:precorrin-2 dehydrogenase/sirohydrochlorin ferrochelatase